VIEVSRGEVFRRHASLAEDLYRTATSSCGNVAEGLGRFAPRDFARFLRIAHGSALELCDHVETARALGLVTPQVADDFVGRAHRAARSISGLIRYLMSCPPSGPPNRNWHQEPERNRNRTRNGNREPNRNWEPNRNGNREPNRNRNRNGN
jgi:four helix bundle protein